MGRVKVWNGVDRIGEMDRLFLGERLGVFAAGGAVSREMRSVIDVLNERYRVVCLFNAMLGVRGEYRSGERIPEYVDEATGLPVYTAFCRERTSPAPEHLAEIDRLVFDAREAGVRYYEYLHCLGECMKACAAAGKPLTVLDRAAPIGGERVEGTICPDTMHTIVGDYGLPNRTALTIGEFARYVNGEFGIGCALSVVPVAGWERRLYLDETDLPWMLPSPSLPSATANLLYAGMCVFEGVATVSEGRGTTKPFELIGAPWIDAEALRARMARKGLSGVLFGAAYFKPSASKHAGQLCAGVQVFPVERDAFDAFRVALALLSEIREMYPDKVVFTDCSVGHDVKELPSAPAFTHYIDKLLATDTYRLGLESGEQLSDRFAAARAAYEARKRKYHLYN